MECLTLITKLKGDVVMSVKVGMYCIQDLDANQLAKSINGMLEEVPGARFMSVSTDVDASTWILAHNPESHINDRVANLLIQAGHVMGDMDEGDIFLYDELEENYELTGVESMTCLAYSQVLVGIEGVTYKIVWR